MRRLAALMSCALLAGAACAGPRGMAGAPQPTTERSVVEKEAGVGLSGRLEGDPERGCLWIVGAGHPVSIVWSRGFEVRRDPLRLVGPDGQAIARPGDFLSLGVVRAPADQSVDCKVSDRVYIVRSVEKMRTPAPQPTAPTP